jgi:hypothetical protein
MEVVSLEAVLSLDPAAAAGGTQLRHAPKNAPQMMSVVLFSNGTPRHHAQPSDSIIRTVVYNGVTVNYVHGNVLVKLAQFFDQNLICRRQILKGFGQLSFLALASSVDAGELPAKSCSDPDNLSNSEQALRKSLDYAEAATNVGQTCAGCSFFALEGRGPCGTCQILNGPVNLNGHCTSWKSKR